MGKLLPNLYYAQYRYMFLYDILHVLLQNIWSELPPKCRDIIYAKYMEINGDHQWLFGDYHAIHQLLTNDNQHDIDYMMTIYLWDGMSGIAMLLTSIILLAIHSKEYNTKQPFIQTHSHKIRKVYKFVYDYIVHKSQYQSDHELSLNVIKKLCHL